MVGDLFCANSVWLRKVLPTISTLVCLNAQFFSHPRGPPTPFGRPTLPARGYAEPFADDYFDPYHSSSSPSFSPFSSFMRRPAMPTPRYRPEGMGSPFGQMSGFGSTHYAGYGRSYAPNYGHLMNPDFAATSIIEMINDKDNFQANGCGWDGVRQRCTDGLNLCKGGCRDFSVDFVTHECRCVPYGYMALMGFGKK